VVETTTAEEIAQIIANKMAGERGARSICRGEYKGELDGKPVPGTLFDGTDAACPGWWRGYDHGYEHRIKKLINNVRALRKTVADLQNIYDQAQTDYGYAMDEREQEKARADTAEAEADSWRKAFDIEAKSALKLEAEAKALRAKSRRQSRAYRALQAAYNERDRWWSDAVRRLHAQGDNAKRVKELEAENAALLEAYRAYVIHRVAGSWLCRVCLASWDGTTGFPETHKPGCLAAKKEK